MIQIQMTFPSIEAATEFLTQRTNSAAPAAAPLRTDHALPLPATTQAPVAVEPEKKRGRPPRSPDAQAAGAAKTQATVVAPSASAAAATDNGASVQPATPPEAGATGGESEKQLPLTGVDPAPPVPTATEGKAYTVDEMRSAAQAVIAKLGQIEGMNKAREVLERVAGVKLIRDVPADKVSAVAAAFEALTA